MKNEIKKFFSQGGAIHDEENQKIIIDDCHDAGCYWCSGCLEFTILDKGKEFECQLCGCATEWMGNSTESYYDYRLRMRRSLIQEISREALIRRCFT